ncbi:MAG: sensor histidine kinase [Elusimicrobiota bacterium]
MMRLNTIGKKLAWVIAAASGVYLLLIGGLCFLTKTALTNRSDDYVRSFSRRFEEDVERALLDRAALVREAVPAAVLPRSEGGASSPWSSAFVVEARPDGSQSVVGSRSEKTPAADQLSPLVRRAVAQAARTPVQIVADPDQPSHFLVVSRLPALAGRNLRVVVARCGYYLLYELFNEIIYEERTQNGTAWIAGLCVKNALVWSPSPKLRGVLAVETAGSSVVDGESYYASLTPVPRSNLNLLLLAPASVYSDIAIIYSVGALCLILAILITWACLRYIGLIISRPIATLVGATHQIARGEFDVRLNFNSTDEIGLLGQAFVSMSRNLQISHNKLAENAALAAIGETATQVAHDIRSPLSSLQTAIERLKRTPEDLQDSLGLLELSTKRLNGIAEDLLERYVRKGDRAHGVFSIHSVLDELVGEWTSLEKFKGIRFVKQYQGAIEFQGNRDRLQRAFGNIIKNGIEAMGGEGALTLTTRVEGKMGVIAIADSGRGMGPEILARILDGRHSQDKTDGHGIGMKIVSEVLKEHGGALDAESEPGKGTTFIVKLPIRRERPFELVLASGETVVLIEDDPSVRLQWELIAGKKAFALKSFESYEDFEAHAIPAATAIVDYHFNNSKLNGIEIIKKLRTKGFRQLILSTAEYWRPSVQQQAKETGVAICPKPIPRIDVRRSDAAGDGGRGERRPDAVLIDDDLLVQATWRISAGSAGRTLRVFSTPEAFMAEAHSLDKRNPIYIDSRLEGGVRGEEFAKGLHAQGFANLYLATGASADSFPPMPWIRKIVGKEAPWKV